MKSALYAVVPVLLLCVAGGTVRADDGNRPEPIIPEATPVAPTGHLITAPAGIAAGCHVTPPAYQIPGFDACPCGNTGCFHPGRYYCGGKQYRRHWFRKWLRAHLGHGSMLDDVPCHCIAPAAYHPAPRHHSAKHAVPVSTPEIVTTPAPAAAPLP